MVKKSIRKTYSTHLECGNCNDVQMYQIPKGVYICTFAEHTPCRLCGCKDVLDHPGLDQDGFEDEEDIILGCKIDAEG